MVVLQLLRKGTRLIRVELRFRFATARAKGLENNDSCWRFKFVSIGKSAKYFTTVGNATYVAETSFRELAVFPSCDELRRALILSQFGGAASAWLRSIASEQGLCFPILLFQVAVRRRVRWVLPLSGGIWCQGCKFTFDPYGCRAAVCSLSGRVEIRSIALERVWARVGRDAGALVREHVLLRDVGIPFCLPQDQRQIEVVATGIPYGQGVPLAIDAILVSPLHANVTVWTGADEIAGLRLRRATRSRTCTYFELVSSSVPELVIAGGEVGARVCSAVSRILVAAAYKRARTEPQTLQRRVVTVWRGRDLC